MTRPWWAFGAALAACAPKPELQIAPPQPQVPCIDGKPAPRPPNVTYGHRTCPQGEIRDHAWPLSSGGPDTWDNVWCQNAAESYKKDALERHWAQDLCAGRIVPKDGLTPAEQAHDYFVGGQWRGDIKP